MSQVIQGDAKDVLAGFDADIIDLTVTSPPYDDLRTYGGYSFDFEPIARELFRVTKPGGLVVWVIGDGTVKGSETGTSFKQALYFKECGFNLHDTMIWLKPHFANPSSNRCHQVFEYMFVLSKGKPKTFNKIFDVPIKYGKPVGKTSLRNRDGSILNTETVRGSKVGDYGSRSNVWKLNTAGQENFGRKVDHPAQFSESLARDHILSWSNEGDTVLDPFAGCGTTLKMAQQLGREYIGIEISPEYIDIINKRVEQPTLV